jgi:hypothetical protein
MPITHTPIHTSAEPEATVPESRFAAVHGILTDRQYDLPDRLIRLQGWRHDDAAAARRAGAALRLAPATCAALGFIVAFTGSWSLAVAALASALVGVFAANHPVETAYNAFACRTGRAMIPANRAAKRLGCMVGTTFFAAITVALVTGHETTATTLAVVMGSVAAAVAITNVCLPSIIFVLVRGSHRATARSMFAR